MKEAEEAKAFSEGQILVCSRITRARTHTHAHMRARARAINRANLCTFVNGKRFIDRLSRFSAGVGGHAQRVKHNSGHQECNYGGGESEF
jgi:hypothetical protein